MIPAGDRSSLRLPVGIFVLTRRFVPISFALALALAMPAAAKDDMKASIGGRAVFQGLPPARPRITMTVDPVCDALYPQGRLADSLVVDKFGGLANVIVHVKSGLDDKLRFTPPAAPLTINLQGCAYTPHVAALRVGQEFVIENQDETLHTVHARAGENPSFVASMPGKDSRIRKALARPGLGVRIRCDRHPWEGIYLGAFEDPYFAVTGADGTFTIGGLPEGDYTLEAWHENLGMRSAKVTVDEGGNATADFSFAGN